MADIAVNVKNLPAPYVSAVGDGVTDDTVAFQSALNTRKKVFIPEGNFVVSNTLNYYTKQEITGVGDASNIISNVIGGAVMTNEEPFFNTHFSKFRIQGNGGESSGIEMLDGYEHFYINYISIVGVGGNGLHLENIYGLSSIGLHIVGLSLTQNGIYAIGSNNVSIKDALIKSCNKGVYANWTYNFTINNCIVESNDGSGVHAIRANSFLISECYFEGNGVLGLLDNNFDVYLSEDETALGSTNFMVKDTYFRSNKTLNTIKIKAKLMGGTLSDLQVSGFENAGQVYMYDVDLLNNGYIKTSGIDTYKLNTNGQSDLIHVSSDIIPIKTTSPIQLQYMDSTAGTTVEGVIPCTINYHHVQFGGLTQVNFDITNINATGVPANRLITISLPIKRSVYGGFFTCPLDFSGSDVEILGLYGVINNVGYIKVSKIGTTANPSTRFDSSNFPGITGLRGSIIYY